MKIALNKACILAFICFILVACGKPAEGYVVSKDYEEAYSYMWMMPMYTGSGRISYIPMMRHCPERYILVVDDEEKVREINVSKEIYESYEIGDYYNDKE